MGPLNPEGDLLAISMIETLEGVRHANEIAAVPGLGAIFIGAGGDLHKWLGVSELAGGRDRPSDAPRGVQGSQRALRDHRDRQRGSGQAPEGRLAHDPGRVGRRLAGRVPRDQLPHRATSRQKANMPLAMRVLVAPDTQARVSRLWQAQAPKAIYCRKVRRPSAKNHAQPGRGSTILDRLLGCLQVR